MLVEVKIGALIMDPNTNTPIVVLKGVESEVILPIWVGAFEANAIALEIEKVAPQRPLTHDLLRNIIIECGYLASKVVITDLLENTFYAILELTDNAGKILSLDARPSDAIALALRLDCPIYVKQQVLQLSSVSQQTDQSTDFDQTVQPVEDWPDFIG
ncbi:MAG: bifunctional nuclease family protein [Acidobacteriota bacterium]|nr:bifunctional nuclease family protein [Acidobacteriota bacterium]